MYWVSPDPVKGSEQAGRRPALVISNDIVNEILPVVTVIPISSLKEKSKVYPTEVYLPAAMVHQIRTIARERLEDRCGSIDDSGLRQNLNHE